MASKRTPSSNKQLLFLLYAYPHTFSLLSVGVNTDKTWALSSPLLPAERYALWFVFFRRKDKARPRFVVDCVVYSVTVLWVTVVWGNGAENLGMGVLMCMTKVVKDDTQMWLMNSFKKSTNAWVGTVVSRYQDFLKNFHKFQGLICIELSRTDWVTTSSVRGGYQNNWLTFTKFKEWGQPWRFFSATGKKWKNFLTESWLVTRLQYSSWMQRPKSSLNSGCIRILPTSPRNLNKHCRREKWWLQYSGTAREFCWQNSWHQDYNVRGLLWNAA